VIGSKWILCPAFPSTSADYSAHTLNNIHCSLHNILCFYNLKIFETTIKEISKQSDVFFWLENIDVKIISSLLHWTVVCKRLFVDDNKTGLN